MLVDIFNPIFKINPVIKTRIDNANYRFIIGFFNSERTMYSTAYRKVIIVEILDGICYQIGLFLRKNPVLISREHHIKLVKYSMV